MKTPTTVLLVVIALLLAANLIPATAQSPPPFDPPQEPTEPTVIGIAATHVGRPEHQRAINEDVELGRILEGHEEE